MSYNHNQQSYPHARRGGGNGVPYNQRQNYPQPQGMHMAHQQQQSQQPPVSGAYMQFQPQQQYYQQPYIPPPQSQMPYIASPVQPGVSPMTRVPQQSHAPASTFSTPKKESKRLAIINPSTKKPIDTPADLAKSPSASAATPTPIQPNQPAFIPGSTAFYPPQPSPQQNSMHSGIPQGGMSGSPGHGLYYPPQQQQQAPAVSHSQSNYNQQNFTKPGSRSNSNNSNMTAGGRASSGHIPPQQQQQLQQQQQQQQQQQHHHHHQQKQQADKSTNDLSVKLEKTSILSPPQNTQEKPSEQPQKSSENATQPPKPEEKTAEDDVRAQATEPSEASAAAATPTAPTDAVKSTDDTTAAEAATVETTDGNAAEEEEEEYLYYDPKYEPGQWTPYDQSGKKEYTKNFLLNFRELITKPPPDSNLKEISKKVITKGVQNVNWVQNNNMPVVRKKKVARIALQRDEVAPLVKSENAWAAHTLDASAIKVEDEQSRQEELMLLKAGGDLNKIAPETFDKIGKRLVDIVRKLPESRLAEFVGLLFMRVQEQHSFSAMYAKLCFKMCNEIKKETRDIRKAILKRCQTEFENDSKVDTEYKAKEEAKKQAKAANPDAKKEVDAAERLKEEEEFEAYMKQKRHMLGNIKFIGELFKLNMVPDRVIHKECMGKLLKQDASEDDLECLIKLVETIGEKLTATTDKRQMDEYFNKIEKISNRQGLSSRIKFKIQDLIELRGNKWVSRRKDAGPKTLDEIRRDAAREIANKAEESRAQQQQQRRSRNNNNNDNNNKGWETPRPKKVDTKHFGIQRPQNSARLGPQSSLRPGAGEVKDGKYTPSKATNRFNALDIDNNADKGTSEAVSEEESRSESPLSTDISDAAKKHTKAIIEEFTSIFNEQEAMECFNDIEESDKGAAFVAEALVCGYEVKPDTLPKLIKLVKLFISKKTLKPEDFESGLSHQLLSLSEDSVDIPRASNVFAQFVAMGVLNGMITMKFLSLDTLGDKNLFGDQMLKLVLDVLASIKLEKPQEASSFYQQLSSPLIEYLPENRRKQDTVDDLVDRKNLKDVVSNPGNEIVSLLEKGESEAITSFVESLPKNSSNVFDVAYGLISYVVSHTTYNDGVSSGEHEEEKKQAKEVLEYLKPLVNEDADLQVHALFALHKIAAEKEFPANFCLRWFIYFDDDFEDEAFKLFKRDTTNKIQKKNVVLEQCKSFYDQLDE